MEFPYNKDNKEFARHLRKNSTLSEIAIWKHLQKKQFLGLKFNRQVTIGKYIVDFFCAKTKVVIEVDGETHIGKQDYDIKRDEYLEELGLTVIHIDARDVFVNLDIILREIAKYPAFRSHTPPPIGGTPLP